MLHHPAKLRSFGSISRSAGALALALCVNAGAYAQEQQGQQQGDGDDQDEKFRQGNEIIFGNVPEPELLALEMVELGEKVEENIKRDEAAKAIAKRDQQFTQEITIQQPHRRQRNGRQTAKQAEGQFGDAI